MEVDRSGCEVLSRAECLRLLSSNSFGRLGLHAGALPVILPVVYALVDDSIVVRTQSRSQLYGATSGSVVAFEADCPPGAPGGGWSVHVTGLVEEVTAPEEVDRLRAGPLPLWADAEDDRFLRIPVHLVSGRRVRAAAA